MATVDSNAPYGTYRPRSLGNVLRFDRQQLRFMLENLIEAKAPFAVELEDPRAEHEVWLVTTDATGLDALLRATVEMGARTHSEPTGRAARRIGPA